LNAFVYLFTKITQACFDLNNFIRKYPTGIITRLSANGKNHLPKPVALPNVINQVNNTIKKNTSTQTNF